MPYIEKDRRDSLERITNTALSPGELNYIITRHIDTFIQRRGLRYDTLNEVIGVLQCIQLELYRRIIAPYENKKMQENGDVYTREEIVCDYKAGQA